MNNMQIVIIFSFRDRTIAYIENKKKRQKDLGMMAFLTKPKELKT